MNNIFTDFLSDSEDETRSEERIISDDDVLMKEENTTTGKKSQNGANFKFLDIASSSKLSSVPEQLKGSDNKILWNRNMTKALIEEYTILLDNFRTPDRRQKDVWVQLARRLQGKGYSVTAEMCDRKFRNLKQSFKTIYYSKRSERSKRRWEFYEDLAVLMPPLPPIRDKSISPPVSPIPNNFHAKSVLKENKLANDVSIDQKQISNSIENCKDPPAWFKEFLVEFKTSQENMIENLQRMHNESKQLEIRKIRLLENILSLMNKTKS